MADRPFGPDDYEITSVQDVRGYYSSIDPTTAAARFMVRGSQNVYKDSNGNIANRLGRKQLDNEAVDSTIASCVAGFVWNTSLDKTLALRVANSKLEVLSDVVASGTPVWYTLLSSLSNTRGVFDTVWDNTDKKDKLIVVLGDHNLYCWSGGITTVASGTMNTITKQGTTTWAQEGFASTGSVIINGVEYTYSGGTATTTLTGVGTNASGLTAGLVAIQKVITSTDTPASSFSNDFIKVIGNRLHVGSYTSRNVYISKDTDYTDFSVPGTRVSGDAELLTLDDAVNGITVRQGSAYISAGTSDWYIVSYEQITVGTTLTEQTKVDKQESSNGAAAYAHEFIDVVNDTIIFLSKDQQLRAFGTFRNLNTPAYPSLSLEVATELGSVDFQGGQLKAVASGENGDLIYIIAPNSGVVYIHQTRTSINPLGNIISDRSWFTPFVWGVSRIDVYNGRTIGFSNANPQTYYLWNTNQWHDDTPSGSVPYISVMLLSYQSYGRRQGKFIFDKVFWEGYMTEGTVLTGIVYFDYQGASGIQSPIIHDSANSPARDQSFFTGSVPPSLGDSSLGDNPLGSPTAGSGVAGLEPTDHDLLPKFKIITPVDKTDCYEYALACYSSNEDARFEIIALGTNVHQSVNQAVELTK